MVILGVAASQDELSSKQVGIPRGKISALKTHNLETQHPSNKGSWARVQGGAEEGGKGGMARRLQEHHLSTFLAPPQAQPVEAPG